MSDDAPVAKQQLRHGLVASLGEISRQKAQASGVAVRDRLLEWEGFVETREVVVFSSLQGEVDMLPLAAAVYAAGKTLLLPRMLGRELEFVPVAAGAELVEGPYGVLEPPGTRDAQIVHEATIILVPGIAFDLAGGRLGRGAGYYDRALARVREGADSSVFIGVGFQLQIVDHVPMSPHDVAMDAVLTEEALVWADGRE